MTVRNPPQDKAHGPPSNPAQLRRLAEEKAGAPEPRDLEGFSPEKARQVLYELRVHQIELEMQNEELRHAQTTLEVSQARYFELYDLAPVGYCAISEKGLILEANLTAATLLGLDRSALVRQPITRFIHKQDQDIYYLHRKQLFDTGTPQVCELKMLRCCGAQFWARVEAAMGRDEESGAPMCRSTISDITDRKQAEEALLASNRQLREIRQQLETSNRQLRKAEKSLITRNRIREILLTVPDEEMYAEVLKVVLDVMESRSGIFGYIDDQGALVVPSMTKRVWDKCDIAGKQNVFPREAWGDSSWPRAIMEKRTHYTNAPSVKTPRGHIAIHRHISVPIIHQGKVVGLFQVANKATDYTAEDAAFLEGIGRATASVLDARLRRDEYERERERLLSATEQAGEMFVITDPQGVIQYVNPAFEEITGYTKAEAIGQNPRMLKSGRQDRAFYRNLWKTISSGRTWKGRFVNRRKDGTLFTEAATISPVRNPSGRIINYVAVKHDITENLRLADQFEQAQKMESVGRLAGGVAHDFNNMLSVIFGYAELALEKVDPADSLHADLEEILNAAKRSSEITRQLLAFARKQTISPQILDINESVEGTLKMLRRLIGEDINLSWRPGTLLWPVRIDPSQLDQILANLCVNARDAITDVGNIAIETKTVTFDQAYCADHPGTAQGDFVLLAVSDNGCGMDKETLDTIFEPFFTTKPMGKGTGLGLATVYGIVKQNEGFIDVHSEPGAGTTFKIYLPRHAAATADDMYKKAAQIPNGRGETLLVVEDDVAILKLAGKILRGRGYTVLTAKTSGEALALARQQARRIHLLVTDVVMPEMNGRELADQTQALCPGLKTLFMSGYTADIIAHRGVLDKGVNFIQKPFSSQDLAIAVRKVLDA